MAQILRGTCIACGSQNTVTESQTDFICEGCGQANKMDAPDFILETRIKNDNTALNSAALTLFKAGKIQEARTRWAKSIDLSATDGEANFGLCCCDYEEKNSLLQAFSQDINGNILSYAQNASMLLYQDKTYIRNYLQLNNIKNMKFKQAAEIIDKQKSYINGQIKQAKDRAKAQVMSFSFFKNAAHYILAKEYSNKADFEGLNKQIDALETAINNISQTIEKESADITKKLNFKFENVRGEVKSEISSARTAASIKWVVVKIFKMLLFFGLYTIVQLIALYTVGLAIPMPVVIIAAVLSGFLWKNKKK